MELLSISRGSTEVYMVLVMRPAQLRMFVLVMHAQMYFPHVIEVAPIRFCVVVQCLV